MCFIREVQRGEEDVIDPCLGHDLAQCLGVTAHAIMGPPGHQNIKTSNSPSTVLARCHTLEKSPLGP